MKLFIPVAILVASIVWAVYEYKNPPVEKSEYYYTAIQYYKDALYEEAYINFEKAFDENPDDAVSRFYMGLCELQKGNYANAVKICKEAVKIDPDLQDLYDEYAIKYYEDLENLKVETETEDEISSDIEILKDAKSNNEKGLEYFDAKDYETALKYFKTAVRIDDSYVYGHYNIGLCYYYLGNYDEAIQAYTDAVDADPTYEDAYFERAYIKYEQENYFGAMTDYTLFINLNNEDPSAYRNRGLAKYKLDNLEGACEDWYKAQELGGDQSDLIPKYCED